MYGMTNLGGPFMCGRPNIIGKTNIGGPFMGEHVWEAQDLWWDAKTDFHYMGDPVGGTR